MITEYIPSPSLSSHDSIMLYGFYDFKYIDLSILMAKNPVRKTP